VIRIDAVDEQQVGLGRGNILRCSVRVGVLAYNGKVSSLAKQADQSFAEKAILSDNIDVRRRRRILIVDLYHAEPLRALRDHLLDCPYPTAT
jgi:hypothetical protein